MFSIRIRQCGKSYNRKWLFRHIDLDMHTGEKWALLGPNGSGKSTFCLMLAGQVFPTEGSLQREFQGDPIDDTDTYKHVSLASPAMELPPEQNVLELMAFHKRMKPMRMAHPEAVLAEICNFDAGTMKNPIQNFSSGMKQRVKLCLAAFSDTPLLILDEPLSNLDAAGILLYDQILQEYTRDRLLVIASNREDEYAICDKRFVLGASAQKG